MTKRIIAVFLILTLLMSAVVLRAAATGNFEISDFNELISNPEAASFSDGVITIPDGNWILLKGTLEIPDGEDIIITGGGVIQRSGTFTGAMVNVPSTSSLTLFNIALDGGAEWASNTTPTPTGNSGIQAAAPVITNSGILSLSKSMVAGVSKPTVIRNNDNRTSGGGAIQNVGTVILGGAVITYCFAAGNGGAINSLGGSVSGFCDSISYNTSLADGGAIAQLGALSTISLGGGTLVRNTSGGNGGAICASEGLLSLADCTIGYNVAENFGGGVYADTSALVNGRLIIDENSRISGEEAVASNLYLASAGASVNRVSALPDGASIGIGIDSSNEIEGKTIVTSGTGTFLPTDADAFFLDDGTNFHLDFNETNDRIVLTPGAQPPHNPEGPVTTVPDETTPIPGGENYVARVKHGANGEFAYYNSWSEAVEDANTPGASPCEIVYVSLLSDLQTNEPTVVKTNWQLTASFTSGYQNYVHTYTLSTNSAARLLEVSSDANDFAQLRIVSGNYINNSPSPDSVTVYADLSQNTAECTCTGICECNVNGGCECNYGKISVFGSTIVCKNGSAIVAHDELYMADYMDGLDETEGKHDSRTVIRSQSAPDSGTPAVVSTGGFVSAGGAIEALGGGTALSLTGICKMQATGVTTTCVCTCAADCACLGQDCLCEGADTSGCRCTCECDCGCDPDTANPAIRIHAYVGEDSEQVGLELAGCKITNTGVGPAIENNSTNRILIREPVEYGQETRGNSIITGRIKTVSPLYVNPGFVSGTPIPVELITDEVNTGDTVVSSSPANGTPDVDSFLFYNNGEYSALAEDNVRDSLVVTNRIPVRFKMNYDDERFETYYIAKGSKSVYSHSLGLSQPNLTPTVSRRVFLGWYYRYGGKDWLVIDTDGNFVDNAQTLNPNNEVVKVLTDENGRWVNTDFDNELYAMWQSESGQIYRLTCSDNAYIIDSTGGRITEGSYAEGDIINIAAPESIEYFPGKSTPFESWSSTNGGTFTAKRLPKTTFVMPAEDTQITSIYASRRAPVVNSGTSGDTTSPPSGDTTTSPGTPGGGTSGGGSGGEGGSGGGGNVIKPGAWDLSNVGVFNGESPLWLFNDPTKVNPDDTTGPDGYLGDPSLDGNNYYEVDIDIPIPQLGGTFDILLLTVIGIMISLTGAYISMKRYYASRVRWNASYRGYY